MGGLKTRRGVALGASRKCDHPLLHTHTLCARLRQCKILLCTNVRFCKLRGIPGTASDHSPACANLA